MQAVVDVEAPRRRQSSLSKMNAMLYLVFEGVVSGASRLWRRASTSSRSEDAHQKDTMFVNAARDFGIFMPALPALGKKS